MKGCIFYKLRVSLFTSLFSFGSVLLPTSFFNPKVDAQSFERIQYGIATDRDCKLALGENGFTYNLHLDNPVKSGYGYRKENGNVIGFDNFPLSKAFSFVRRTGSGACIYEIFNGKNYKGRSRVIGADLNKRIRLGWRARSVRIIKVNNNDCRIAIGDGGATQTFIGRGVRAYSVNPWSFIRYTSGNCIFRVYNGSNFKGRSVTYGDGIRNRVRVGWRIRSLEIL